MEKFTSSPLSMLCVSVLLGSFGQLFLKLGMKAQSASASSGLGAFSNAVKSIANPKVFLGFCLYGISSILWLVIIKKTPLSLAYPMISFSYVIVVILSSIYLKEPIARTTVLGLLLICGGVALIGIGMSQVGGK